MSIRQTLIKYSAFFVVLLGMLGTAAAQAGDELYSMPSPERLIGHSGGVNSVAYLPDERTVVSGSWDNTLKLWDVASGSELSTLSGHTRHVNAVPLPSLLMVA